MATTSRRNNPNESPDNESLDSFKAFLGPIAARYTDPQLVQLRRDMHDAARLLLDLYLLKKYPEKNNRQPFDNSAAGT
jgi:hypothetical protein